MLDQIPSIPPNSYLVLFADADTGILLNNNFQFKTGPLERAHYFFESLEEAINFIIDKIETSEATLEGLIYNDQKEFIKQVQKSEI